MAETILANKDRAHATPVWKALAHECLPSRGRDLDHWWNITGFHLANLIDRAGYSTERQYQVLLFHYHNIVPYFGHAPDSKGNVAWKSIMSTDGSPIEYSWKWSTKPEGKPEIRYSMEAIGDLSGSAIDPLNQQRGRELMQHLATVVPTANFDWAHHFLAHLFDHDTAKYHKENVEGGMPPRGTLGHGVEYGHSGISIKTYFSSRRLGSSGHPTLEQWDEAIRRLDPNNANRDALLGFLKENPEGKLLTPFTLAPDGAAADKARLKLYFTSPNTSFTSLREILTMGGSIKVSEESLQDLRSLITTVLSLPDDYAEDEAIPSKPWTPPAKEIFNDQPALLGGYCYYFDIPPGLSKTPDIRFYLPVRQYGPDDGSIANSVAKWMKAHGRGAYASNFLQMMEGFAEHRKLDEGKGLQTYIGCIITKNGDLDVTSYFGPEMYHPARFASTNGINGH
ncbi:hypothetical protein KVR01_011566 [Diaporthe batatas]|uniref:uncharacterized protein n=1 Tax=Diaporthe batatas TaxID=748121 RepID=UPI001D051376|nr:uncharacterized protein KVR01_011566 [Diaporthe batatas]KAG8158444.1 hypothetical protein KVR01_011566 [Diaporthe batatas]